MIDERTEAILLEALSETNGGERVTVDRHADGGLTMRTNDLTCVLIDVSVPSSGSPPPPPHPPLTPDDAMIAVEALDAYLRLSDMLASLPGGQPLRRAASTAIRSVREKLRARL